MATASNGDLARTIYDSFNRDDYAGALALATDDWQGVAHHIGMSFSGKDGFMQFMQGFKGAFPDCVVTITNQVQAGDQIVNEISWVGTNTGPLLTPAGEIPPTGRTVRSIACEVWRIKDGKLATIQNYQDGTTILAQLGLLPQAEPVGL
jgi:steroid delta-isomerase-like uncharacterized protein